MKTLLLALALVACTALAAPTALACPDPEACQDPPPHPIDPLPGECRWEPSKWILSCIL